MASEKIVKCKVDEKYDEIKLGDGTVVMTRKFKLKFRGPIEIK